MDLKTQLVPSRPRFPDCVFTSFPLPGLSSNVVPMYLGELAPKNMRGALGVVPQLLITIGILVAQIFGLRSLLANKEGNSGCLWSPSPPSAPTGCFYELASWLSL